MAVKKEKTNEEIVNELSDHYDENRKRAAEGKPRKPLP